MNIAFLVDIWPVIPDRFAVRAELQQIGALDQLGAARPGKEKTLRLVRMTDADMAVAVAPERGLLFRRCWRHGH